MRARARLGHVLSGFGIALGLVAAMYVFVWLAVLVALALEPSSQRDETLIPSLANVAVGLVALFLGVLVRWAGSRITPPRDLGVVTTLKEASGAASPGGDLGEAPIEPGPLLEASRRQPRLSRRDRDWQIVVVAVCLIAMFLFEMFHSPPCRLGWTGCSGLEFVAQVGVNAIWAIVMGTSTGVALAAIMSMVVDSLDVSRSKGTNAPLVRAVLGITAVVMVFVIVLVRFEFVRS